MGFLAGMFLPPLVAIFLLVFMLLIFLTVQYEDELSTDFCFDKVKPTETE
jgi:hypothetical protein